MRNKIAAKAARRLLDTDEKLAAQREGALADRGFDGGEWSDAHHAEAICDIEDAIIDRCASRFGLSREDLWSAVTDLEFAQENFYHIAPAKGESR